MSLKCNFIPFNRGRQNFPIVSWAGISNWITKIYFQLMIQLFYLTLTHAVQAMLDTCILLLQQGIKYTNIEKGFRSVARTIIILTFSADTGPPAYSDNGGTSKECQFKQGSLYQLIFSIKSFFLDQIIAIVARVSNKPVSLQAEGPVVRGKNLFSLNLLWNIW